MYFTTVYLLDVSILRVIHPVKKVTFFCLLSPSKVRVQGQLLELVGFQGRFSGVEACQQVGLSLDREDEALSFWLLGNSSTYSTVQEHILYSYSICCFFVCFKVSPLQVVEVVVLCLCVCVRKFLCCWQKVKGGHLSLTCQKDMLRLTHHADVRLLGDYLLACWHEFSLTSGSSAGWACWIRGGTKWKQDYWISSDRNISTAI